MARISITGSTGFVDLCLASLLVDKGFEVDGYEGITDYCDVRLQQPRQKIILHKRVFARTKSMLQGVATLDAAIDNSVQDVIVHMAPEAGARYSPENPRSCP